MDKKVTLITDKFTVEYENYNLIDVSKSIMELASKPLELLNEEAACKIQTLENNEKAYAEKDDIEDIDNEGACENVKYRLPNQLTTFNNFNCPTCNQGFILENQDFYLLKNPYTDLIHRLDKSKFNIPIERGKSVQGVFDKIFGTGKEGFDAVANISEVIYLTSSQEAFFHCPFCGGTHSLHSLVKENRGCVLCGSSIECRIKPSGKKEFVCEGCGLNLEDSFSHEWPEEEK